jgi:endo-1,4-beta-xylanase
VLWNGRLARREEEWQDKADSSRADNYATVVQACLDNGNCPGVTVWGFDDGHSWIPGVFAGQGDANLYDFNYQPKPAYYSTLAALQNGK